MAKATKKRINSMWGGRFSSPSASTMEKINSSIAIDYRLANQDIRGSIAHVKMLLSQNIISKKVSENILKGLDTIAHAVSYTHLTLPTKRIV